MDSAQAASISHADYVVEVHGRTTTVQYDLSTFARAQMIFSLWPEMQVRRVGESELRDAALAKMQDARKHDFEQMIKLLTTLYVQDECCVCISAPPRVVLIPCGHQAFCCACYDVAPKPVKNCYLCREPVVSARTVPE
jgi:hypothetical protein